jgi:nucleoside-diphosphate-sugar epimerase
MSTAKAIASGRTKRHSGTHGKPAPSASLEADSSPERYIARVDLKTGKEVPGPIDPDELLVHAHRDKHPVELTAQFLASRFIQVTGNERFVRDGLRLLNRAGATAAEAIGWASGQPETERRVKKLLGVTNREVGFQFRETSHLTDKEVRARVEQLQKQARSRLQAWGRNPRLHVLLTGGTGFLGKEIIRQAAEERRIERVVAVVRPETIRDHKTKEVLKVLSPAQRGALLLKRLGITGSRAKRFRFVEGDIEKPELGLAPAELEELRRTLTHVVHCAASVSFDDSYENSYRANVLGNRNALAFSRGVQEAEGSRFVAHVAIETSYVHGRRKRSIALESGLAFPRHFYNNFYELTKAMASIETDRALIGHGLRVMQLLPSIVIGHSATGNNHGDTKVVNAPINAFGRAKEALAGLGLDPAARVRAALIRAVALSFPGDRSAELNLVPVDRVASGILAALYVPEAIGARIHLATDDRIRCEDIVRISREELGINVRLADPTLFRNVTLPLVKAGLGRLNEPRLASALEKLGTIFGVYGEWGQPIHDVGNDVRILGLPLRRPHTAHAFRMLCRHNKYVQEFGRVRDPDEIGRRERAWEKAIAAMAFKTGREVATIPAGEFRSLLAEEIDLKAFRPR